MLDTVFFGLDYQISLIYRLPDTGEYFQIFPDEEEQNSQEEEDSDVLRISNNPEDERRQDSCEHSSSAAGVFAGFVLLSDCSWDKEKLIRDLREEWNLNAEEEGTQQEDILIFRFRWDDRRGHSDRRSCSRKRGGDQCRSQLHVAGGGKNRRGA